MPSSGPLLRQSVPLPDEPIDVFGGEDVSTTKRLAPERSAKDDVLDLNLFPGAPQPTSPTTSVPAALKVEKAERAIHVPTLAMSSVAAPRADEAARKASNGHSLDQAGAVTMPLADNAQGGSETPAAVLSADTLASDDVPSLSLDREPIANASVPDAPRTAPRRQLTLPPRAEPDTVSLASADDAVEVVPSAPAAPPASVVPSRVTPADIAASAYVSPTVDSRARRERRRRSAIPIMPIVAMVVMAVCAVIIWQFVVKERVRPVAQAPTQPPRAETKPTTPTPVGASANRLVSAPNGPAPSSSDTAAMPAPSVAATPAAAPPPVPRSESAARIYTIQVMSAKDQAATAAAVERLVAAGADAYVMRADLGDRGIWYRCRCGQFASRADAQRVGAELVSSGRIQSFIIVPYEAAT